MKTYELHIKNMVCDRCIHYVQQILHELDIFPYQIELGKVLFSASGDVHLACIENELKKVGLFIIVDKDEKITESIKINIIKYLDKVESGCNEIKLSSYLADQMAKNYYGLSKLFSKTEDQTIESYFINRKIDRVKQLLRENELTLSEIAYQLDYSNVQHLSKQFKKVAGYSVSQYKELLSTDDFKGSNKEMYSIYHREHSRQLSA